MKTVKITYSDGSEKRLNYHHLKMRGGKLQLFNDAGEMISEETDIEEFEEQSQEQVLEEKTENFIALLSNKTNQEEKREASPQELKKRREEEEAKKREAAERENAISNVLRRVSEKFNEQKNESYEEEADLSAILLESLSKYNTIRQKGSHFNLTGFITYLRIHHPNLLDSISDDEDIVREQVELAVVELLRTKKISYAPFYNQEVYTIINKYKHDVRPIFRSNPDNMKNALDVFKMTNAGEKKQITLIDWVVFFLKSNLGRR